MPKLRKDYTISIPIEACKKEGIKPGDTLNVFTNSGCIVIIGTNQYEKLLDNLIREKDTELFSFWKSIQDQFSIKIGKP